MTHGSRTTEKTKTTNEQKHFDYWYMHLYYLYYILCQMSLQMMISLCNVVQTLLDFGAQMSFYSVYEVKNNFQILYYV